MPDYQMPLFQPKSEWKPIQVSALPSWAGVKRLGLDIETYDPKLKTLGPGVRRGGRIIGVSFAIEDGPAFYLPIGHPEDNLSPEHVFGYLTDQFKEYDGEVVGANLPYDLDYLWERKVLMPKVKRYRDIQVADPLIDELQLRYSMEEIAKRHAMPGKDETLLREAAERYNIDAKKGLWQLPGRFVGPYATQDAVLPLQILRRQERLIEEQGLENIYDLETRLTPVLLKMRRKGVRIDLKKLQEVEDWTIVEQRKELAKIKELTGCKLSMDDVNKAKALVAPLSTIAKINIGKTKTGAPQIDKEFLKGLKHPVADAIQRARKMDKLRGTFVNSIREHMCYGRIHPTFNQLRRSSDSEGDNEDDQGGRYGRLSSCDPNIQQQPARDPEIGKLWRSIYIPEDGELWAAMDYSQQEPRGTYHYAMLSGCAGAEAMVERFRSDPKADSHTEMTRMCYGEAAITGPNFKKLRSYCKEIFLGITYGMGGAKLCHKLNLPTIWKMSSRLGKLIEVAGPEGQAILDEVDQKMPFLRQLAKLCERRARDRGYIVTLLGRRCRFPRKQDNPNDFDWCHKALNRLIQGSAADQTKLAVVQADEAGHELTLQVHDEIDASVRNEAHAEEIADIMRNCVQLLLPSKVDVELGDSWGASMGN